MEKLGLETEALPEAAEKDKKAEIQGTTPESAEEIFVPVKYNKEIRNLGLKEAA